MLAVLNRQRSAPFPEAMTVQMTNGKPVSSRLRAADGRAAKPQVRDIEPQPLGGPTDWQTPSIRGPAGAGAVILFLLFDFRGAAIYILRFPAPPRGQLGLNLNLDDLPSPACSISQPSLWSVNFLANRIPYLAGLSLIKKGKEAPNVVELDAVLRLN
ncbi:hypothetical protein AB0C10_21075 [Microbispora amethystogenes]|uniref:hypothetical protein n=1 Tax=Microbispora amethystogenes TaxID=1427754 RepID=UPI0033E89999